MVCTHRYLSFSPLSNVNKQNELTKKRRIAFSPCMHIARTSKPFRKISTSETMSDSDTSTITTGNSALVLIWVFCCFFVPTFHCKLFFCLYTLFFLFVSFSHRPISAVLVLYTENIILSIFRSRCLVLPRC